MRVEQNDTHAYTDYAMQVGVQVINKHQVSYAIPLISKMAWEAGIIVGSVGCGTG